MIRLLSSRFGADSGRTRPHCAAGMTAESQMKPPKPRRGRDQSSSKVAAESGRVSRVVRPGSRLDTPMDETPALLRAAARSADGRTVALVFGTNDFDAIITNWACHAMHINVHWFVLVAMDRQLHTALLSRPALRSHTVLLPRLRDGNTTITKLNVIGERQRFGLAVLEAGLSVVHSDADALWMRDPTPLFTGGDVVAERIWGKPLSVIRAWGAGICTGFYFMRSTRSVLALARSVRDEVARKRVRQPGVQASDQYWVNVVLHRHGVQWRDGKMAGMADIRTRFYDPNASVGVASTPHGQIRVVMLAHCIVPRACPVLSPAELRSLAPAGTYERRPRRPNGKAKFWKRLLDTAYVLHCFPPEKGPQPGEKRFIFMGHERHTNAELAFARRQGLWRVASGDGGECRTT